MNELIGTNEMKGACILKITKKIERRCEIGSTVSGYDPDRGRDWEGSEAPRCSALGWMRKENERKEEK